MRRSARTLLILVLASGAVAPAWAVRSGRIAGTVKAREGSGLLGAVVTIFKESTQGGTISFTRSDRHGAYTIANLSPGAYHVQVSRPGYEPLTQENIKIDAGKTTTLDVILQTFIDLIGSDDDPRNWDFRTVLRSTSDRRMIFRHLEGPTGLPDVVSRSERTTDAFARGGSVNVSSSAGLSGENYSIFPSNGRNGIVSNFAFAEPVGDHGRMIFSGQLNSGYDSLWRVRNTYQYRPESGRDLRMSVGYGRLSLNGPSPNNVSRPAQFFNQDPALREGGVQTLAVSLESRNKVLDPIAVEYGMDYSRVNHRVTRSIFSPYFNLIVTPTEAWTIKTGVMSRRLTDNNNVALPDGEVVNLTEPIYLSQVDGELHLSQFKHSEISVTRQLADESSVEVAAYEDHMVGPGTPYAITERSGGDLSEVKTLIGQLRQDQSSHHGVRLAMNHRFLDFLTGSIAYVYGTGTALTATDTTAGNEALARDLLNYLHRSYYHSISGRFDTRIPKTGTQISTIVRWYPGISLSPIDLFYDPKDTLTKGFHVFVRQAIPLPEFMGTPGRWEALVDLRNIFDQGRGVIRTSDGEVSVTRNPRSIRFGLNLNLY